MGPWDLRIRCTGWDLGMCRLVLKLEALQGAACNSVPPCAGSSARPSCTPPPAAWPACRLRQATQLAGNAHLESTRATHYHRGRHCFVKFTLRRKPQCPQQPLPVPAWAHRSERIAGQNSRLRRGGCGAEEAGRLVHCHCREGECPTRSAAAFNHDPPVKRQVQGLNELAAHLGPGYGTGRTGVLLRRLPSTARCCQLAVRCRLSYSWAHWPNSGCSCF